MLQSMEDNILDGSILEQNHQEDMEVSVKVGIAYGSSEWLAQCDRIPRVENRVRFPCCQNSKYVKNLSKLSN